MLSYLTPRERTVYLGFIVLLLSFCAYIGARVTHRPAAMIIQESSPPRPNQSGLNAVSKPSSSSEEVLIHVIGAVKKAGVYRLAAGSRVTDAILAAGGPVHADTDQVNLAAKVLDGTQLDVPKQGSHPSGDSSSAYRSTKLEDTPYAATVSATTGKKGGKGPPHPVDLNSASAEQLQAVPGIGPSTAQRIVEFRASHGAFQSVEELSTVGGIGPKKLEKMRPWVHT